MRGHKLPPLVPGGLHSNEERPTETAEKGPGGRPDAGEHLSVERSQLEKLVQTQKW